MYRKCLASWGRSGNFIRKYSFPFSLRTLPSIYGIFISSLSLYLFILLLWLFFHIKKKKKKGKREQQSKSKNGNKLKRERECQIQFGRRSSIFEKNRRRLNISSELILCIARFDILNFGKKLNLRIKKYKN